MSGDQIEYCGGEMDGWSDPAATDDVLVAHAGRMLPPDAQRYLLVGARAASLAEGLVADGRSVTAVVRGTTDAERLAATGVRVVCGSFDSWQPAQRFDCAIALDPPQHLLTATSDGLGALELVARVRDCADNYLALVENGAALPSLDRRSKQPSTNAEFASGTGYDPRPPVLAELDTQPKAVVFSGAVVSVDASRRADAQTLLRSLLGADLRYDALLGHPMSAADGWLLGAVAVEAELTYRRLDGTLARVAPRVEGTPVETRLRQMLLRGDLVRVRTGLRAYAQWADAAPAPLLRNLVASDRAFVPIDEGVAAVELPVAMLDLASTLSRTEHPFGPELTRDEIATELLRLATDTDDPATEITSAATGYDGSTLARSAPEGPDGAGELVMNLRVKDAQIAALKADLAKDRRHLRALEHALATEAGPRAKRAYFLMTAPTKRLVEAARRRR